MQLGQAVDAFACSWAACVGVSVFEVVDGAVGVVLETPGAAEVDDSNAVLDGARDPLAGLARAEWRERGLRSRNRRCASQLKGRIWCAWRCRGWRVADGGLRGRPGRFSLGFAGAAEEVGCGAVEAGMMQQQARQFAAGIATDSCDGGAGRDVRLAVRASIRSAD